jgi:GGDEF domain-containing protein
MYLQKRTIPLTETPLEKFSLPSRVQLENIMDDCISKATREGYEVALVIVHFVNLASVSQTVAPEQLLGETSKSDFLTNYVLQYLRSTMAHFEVIAQLEETSFALLLHHCNEVEAYRLALQMQKSLDEDALLAKLPIPLIVRYGISSYPQLARDTNALLTQANMALQNGRKLSRTLNTSTIKIWKASPSADLKQLVTLDDLEVCRAILLGYNYNPIPRSAYRWLDGDIIPFHFARSNLCLPVKKQKDVLTVAMPNPADQTLISELARLTGCSIVPVVSTRAEIEKALQYLSRAFV